MRCQRRNRVEYESLEHTWYVECLNGAYRTCKGKKRAGSDSEVCMHFFEDWEQGSQCYFNVIQRYNPGVRRIDWKRGFGLILSVVRTASVYPRYRRPDTP